jgi:hypothetical protein
LPGKKKVICISISIIQLKFFAGFPTIASQLSLMPSLEIVGTTHSALEEMSDFRLSTLDPKI